MHHFTQFFLGVVLGVVVLIGLSFGGVSKSCPPAEEATTLVAISSGVDIDARSDITGLKLQPSHEGATVLSPTGACPNFDFFRAEIAEFLSPKPPPPAVPRTYLIIGRRGGLGNQLFQVAAGIRLALAWGRTPLLGPAELNPHATVTYENTVFRSLCVIPSDFSPTSAIITEDEAAYFMYSPPSAPSDNAPVAFMQPGIWQHWRYTIDIPLPLLRAMFGPMPALTERLEKAYGPLANCVAVHVRRGDYVDIGAAAGVGMAYFEAALKRFEAAVGGPLPCLLVASDDLSWARLQTGFISRGARFVDGEDEVATFYLLVAARRGIICPNSTFCWWAAYLGRDDGGISNLKRPIILPRPWWTFSSNADDAFFFSGVDAIDRREWGSEPTQ